MPTLPLTSEVERRIGLLFPPEQRDEVRNLLATECGNNLPFQKEASPETLDRFRFAALKLSEGDMAKLHRAIRLAQRDWRDLLVAAGFANDIHAHQRWLPEPSSDHS